METLSMSGVRWQFIPKTGPLVRGVLGEADRNDYDSGKEGAW